MQAVELYLQVDIRDLVLREALPGEIIGFQATRSDAVTLETIQERMRAVVDAEMLEAFSQARAHFGTSDLVIFFEEAIPRLTAVPRKAVIQDPDAPIYLRENIGQPASKLGFPSGDDIAFWLVFFGADGMSGFCAMHLKRVALPPAGSRIQ